MKLDEAVKLVVALHMRSEKLQREIIAKDMDLASLIESALAIELRQRKVSFIKQNTMESDKVTKESDFQESKAEYETNVNVKINNNKI